jgi:zinc-binding alcohol dehydrogenase/oxidoreductase
MGTNEDFGRMMAFVEDKKVKPIVDVVFPLEETEQAMRYMDAGKQFGKIVVKVG